MGVRDNVYLEVFEIQKYRSNLSQIKEAMH